MNGKVTNFVKIGDMELSDPYPYDDKEPLETYRITLRKGSMNAAVDVPAKGTSSIVTIFDRRARGKVATGFISGQDIFDLKLYEGKDNTFDITINLRNFAEKWSVEARTRLDADDMGHIARQLKRFFRLQ